MLVEIPCGAFSGCHSLTKFSLPDSVQVIGCGAFANCKNLLCIHISRESSLHKIGGFAFLHCYSLKVFFFPTLFKPGGSKFDLSSIEKVETDERNQFLSIAHGLIRDKLSLEAITCFRRGIQIVVPPSVEILGIDCFSHCTGISEVRFANGSRVRQIPTEAFSGCSSLSRITIPASVEVLYRSCFADCSSLYDVTLDVNEMAKSCTLFAKSCTLTSV
jgi:hypothetical protein